MKNTFLFPCLFVLVASGPSQSSAQVPSGSSFEVKQLTGSWEGKDGKGDNGSIQFQPGGFAQLTINGERLVPVAPGGPSLKFVVNSTKSPMWVDFIMFDPSGKEVGRMKCIMQLKGSKEMKVRIGEKPSIRPEDFDAADDSDTLILKKIY